MIEFRLKRVQFRAQWIWNTLISLNQLILLKTTFKINSLTLQIANSEVNSNYQVHQQVFVELFHILNNTLYILLGNNWIFFGTGHRAGGFIGIRTEIFLLIRTLPELYSTHTANITVQNLQAEGHLTMTSPCPEIKKSDHLSTSPLPMLQALDMRSIWSWGRPRAPYIHSTDTSHEALWQAKSTGVPWSDVLFLTNCQVPSPGNGMTYFFSTSAVDNCTVHGHIQGSSRILPSYTHMMSWSIVKVSKICGTLRNIQ